MKMWQLNIDGEFESVDPEPIENIFPGQHSEGNFFSFFAPNFWIYGRPVCVDGVDHHVAIVPGNQKDKDSDCLHYKVDALIKIEGKAVGFIDPERKYTWDGVGGFPCGWTVNVPVHPVHQQFGNKRNPNSRTAKLWASKEVAEKDLVGWIALHSNFFGDSKRSTKPNPRGQPSVVMVPSSALYWPDGVEKREIKIQDTRYGPCYVFIVPKESCFEFYRPEDFELYFEKEIVALIRRRNDEN